MVLLLLLSPMHKIGMSQIGLFLQSGCKEEEDKWKRATANLTGNVIDKLTFDKPLR